MEFRVTHSTPSGSYKNVAFLLTDKWNDFNFVTQFRLIFFDDNGVKNGIGPVKIGFRGQSTDSTTYSKLGNGFSELGYDFFSLGQTADFYTSIFKLGESGKILLKRINDIVYDNSLIDSILDEEVFKVSLLRDHSLSVIKGQFQRLLNGDKPLTEFNFSYIREESSSFSQIKLNFDVLVDSKPNTNIHAIIGRNGIGKTTLLNDIINIVNRSPKTIGKLIERKYIWNEKQIDETYFSALVSISFSAFDPFIPPTDQPDPTKGTCYYYVGLKDVKNEGFHRNLESLYDDFCKALSKCFNDKNKERLWISAINNLGYDENFSSSNLSFLKEIFIQTKKEVKGQSDSFDFNKKYLANIKPILNKLSSGHSIVLISITRLVATVQEKTLVLIDEPESHLHPPLLSAFIRALSELLFSINGIAIIATHSPVVLQELPKMCVWKIYRQGNNTIVDRPKIETFAENLEILTSEVFSLEVELSGFHKMLKESVDSSKSYDDILSEYNNQIGYEGRSILKALIADRDRKN